MFNDMHETSSILKEEIYNMAVKRDKIEESINLQVIPNFCPYYFYGINNNLFHNN